MAADYGAVREHVSHPDHVRSQGSPGGRPFTESPERKRASLPRPERMAQASPTFGLTPSEKRTLDLVTDHPMIPREHLALWLGVSEGRVSQMMRSLVDTWGLIERHGKRGNVRYTLSAEGIRFITHRDRAQLPTTRGIWSTTLTTDRQGRRRHLGHRIETWARQTIARMVTGRVVGVSPAVGRSSVGMGVAVATVEPGVGARSPLRALVCPEVAK